LSYLQHNARSTESVQNVASTFNVGKCIVTRNSSVSELFLVKPNSRTTRTSFSIHQQHVHLIPREKEKRKNYEALFEATRDVIYTQQHVFRKGKYVHVCAMYHHWRRHR
ncbi:hypothetical protein L9F63_023281, partial [Diploptera punctata]